MTPEELDRIRRRALEQAIEAQAQTRCLVSECRGTALYRQPQSQRGYCTKHRYHASQSPESFIRNADRLADWIEDRLNEGGA